MGRDAEAKEALLAALATEPGNARVTFNLGTLVLHEGDAAGARDWFLKSIQSDPSAASTWAQLGLAQARLEDADGAASSWRKAVELDPRQYNSLYNLAVWELKAGHPASARQKLERFVAGAPRARFADQLAQARKILQQLRGRPAATNQVP
jgi:Tfp pilus assembly protein PilF